LALPPAAGEIRLAVPLDLADVPANGFPAFSHGGLFRGVRNAPTNCGQPGQTEVSSTSVNAHI
jgi:hypothetical protein